MAKPRKKGKSGIDFSSVHTRFVALRIAYNGRDYKGNAHQSHEENTVEGAIVAAALRAQLAPSFEFTCLSRAGRTDAGVSAAGNVVVMRLRCQLTSGVGVKAPGWQPVKGQETSGVEQDDEELLSNAVPNDTTADNIFDLQCDHLEGEIDYPLLFNRLLPESIRVSGWVPVADTFSARFSCRGRCYRYFFMRKNRNILRMKQAGQDLVGVHDYRNFCKVDALAVRSWEREIYRFDVISVEAGKTAYEDIFAFHIEGSAFLRNQVRMMVAILFWIGEGKEDVDLVKKLLDIHDCPRRPAYPLASGSPLVLLATRFPSLRFHLSGECPQKQDSGWTVEFAICDEAEVDNERQQAVPIERVAVKNQAADELAVQWFRRYEQLTLDRAIERCIQE